MAKHPHKTRPTPVGIRLAEDEIEKLQEAEEISGISKNTLLKLGGLAIAKEILDKRSVTLPLNIEFLPSEKKSLREHYRRKLKEIEPSITIELG